MRLALALACTLAVAGCSDLFSGDKAPEGIACSTAGTCPPGMQCVPSEHVCRTPCTQTSMNGGMTGPMQNGSGQCSNINNGGNTGQAYNCDYDHFCRPSCMGGGGVGTCSGCSGTDVCDNSVFICRPACGVSACAMNWGCVDVSGSTGGGGTPMLCAGCRPTATSTFLPPQFAPVIFYDGAGGQQYPIDAGDLVGNGRPDIIMTDGPGKKIYVYANDGTGALMAPVTYTTPVGPFHSVVADMNRDGKADVVVATAMNSLGGPVLYPGNGDHTLGTPVVGPNVTATQLAAGDLDGDGKPEIVQIQSGSSQLTIMTADGMGGLKTLTSVAMPGGNTSFVRVGVDDFNADQHLDLWGDDEHDGFRLFQSNGSATSLAFSAGPSVNAGMTRYDATTADMDGDGKLDFVWVQENAAANPMMPATIGLAKSNGGTSFTITSMAAQVPTSGILAIADFDGDGHRDVAMLEVQANGKSNVDVLSNDGTRLTWSEQISISKGVPYTVAATDLDGDGKPDLVVGLATGGLAVLINQTPSR